MDPITLIVTALAAGTAAGLNEAASPAVKDAYDSLKALVRKRFAGLSDGEMVLVKHEKDPETWRAPLAVELDEAGSSRDPDLIEAPPPPDEPGG